MCFIVCFISNFLGCYRVIPCIRLSYWKQSVYKYHWRKKTVKMFDTEITLISVRDIENDGRTMSWEQWL